MKIPGVYGFFTAALRPLIGKLNFVKPQEALEMRCYDGGKSCPV
jgi:hypothetical protein